MIPVLGQEIKGGSGAFVLLEEDQVRKSAPIKSVDAFGTLREQCCWMKFHSSVPDTKYNAPEVYDENFSDDRYFYTMERIQGSDISRIINPDMYARLLYWLKEVLAPIEYPSKRRDFDYYIERLFIHINLLSKTVPAYDKMQDVKVFQLIENGKNIKIPNISWYEFVKALEKFTPFLNKYYSNNHGDCTLENIFLRENSAGTMVFIDPYYVRDGYNSWLLDVSKIFQSIHFSYEEAFNSRPECSFKQYAVLSSMSTFEWNYYENPAKNDELMSKTLSVLTEEEYAASLLLEATHYLRMLKYKIAISEKDFIKAYIRLCQSWQSFKELTNAR